MDEGLEPEREDGLGRWAGWCTPSWTGGASGGLGGGWESWSAAWREALWCESGGGEVVLLW